ncbi:MAG: ATP synthase subunit delta [Alphaproteobacteria bacterium MarineAlpha11_Bin1]|nr:MAG: ATP synthase subunit delta [Alphaproteobacteria bacterium MarineAlpha11_Bin1]
MPSPTSVTSGVAGRYAAALFEIAGDQKNLDEVLADSEIIVGLLGESDDLRRLVASPVIGREAQGAAISAVLDKAGVSELTRNFVGVVSKNRRLFALSEMCIAYRELLAARRGEMSAEVVSAKPLSDAQRDSLERALRGAIGSKITLDTRVDNSILGGLIVKVGSQMVDSSLKTKIQRLEISLKGAA